MKLIAATAVLSLSLPNDYYENIHSAERKPAKFDIEPILDMALGALQAPT